MIQIKEDEESLCAKEHDRDETKEGIRVGDGVKSKPDHESRGQVVSGKNVGLPRRVRIKPIGPSGRNEKEDAQTETRPEKESLKP